MNLPQWSVGVLFVSCASAFLSPAQAEEKSASEVIIKMDPYVVSGERVLPPPESWRYVSVPALERTKGNDVLVAPGYEVLSNLSEKNTRIFVEELQLLQFTGTLFWPLVERTLPRHPPMIIVLDRTKQAWSAKDKTNPLSWQGDPITATAGSSTGFDSSQFRTGLQSLTPMQGFGSDPLADPTLTANPMGTRITPSNQDPNNPDPTAPDTYEPDPFAKRGGRRLPAGFTHVRAENGIVAAQVNADKPLAAADELPTEEALADDLSGKIAEFALASLPQKPPLWFRSGMGWLVATTQVSPTRIIFGDTKGMFDKNETMPPLAALLTKTEALTYEDDLLAAAFTHYGLCGNDNKNAAKFMTLVERQTQGPITAPQFKEIMGSSIEEMEVTLANYARNFASYKSHEVKDLPPMTPFAVREATQSEVARLQAESLITQHKPDQALNALRIAYWRGERDLAMLSVLADLEEQQGSLDRARKISQALITLPAPPPRVFLVEARLRYRDILANKKPGEKITAKETQIVMGPLGRAVQAGQSSEDVWTFFSDVVLRSGGRPHESITTLLERALKRFPNNAHIQEAASFAKTPTVSTPATTP